MPFLDKLSGKLSTRDIAIDLGTANTRIYVKGEGIVLDEPSVVSLNTVTGAVIAVGREAREMVGRTPIHIRTTRPLVEGVSSDFAVTERMLRFFMQSVLRKQSLARPVVVVSTPVGTTRVEQRAVEEAAMQAGAKAVYLIEEPLAAAIGAGLPIHEPIGNMVVDLGAGASEAAVISLGGIVVSQSLRMGGDDLDDCIIQMVKRRYGIIIGSPTAETIKVTVGSTSPAGPLGTDSEATGMDTSSGLPRTVRVAEEDVKDALEEPAWRIVNTIKEALDATPPELITDIIERGMTLTGGGALLRGMEARVQEETGVPVLRADRPTHCVATGAGRCLEEFRHMRMVMVQAG